ncbi:class I SAM-dependent methyltransferase [Sphaerisporangium siamense]|uniref:SAM-dependent methyltransferase n=1 Tax=Sphaerisporangium siamense TaxID=795645 RepID=A0A7W7D8V6_9ACTN|nr:class I SAM-dependent methyltransferase [Sphaerisporangium siamense]MBB4702420.1 SAM-dependent methyltransferase [Sphaerisporangium siamense]
MTTDLSVRDTNVYAPEVSEVYDLLYQGRGKDYAREARILVDLIRARKADANSLVDVACGTGEHLRTLRTVFDHVEGVELSDTMRAAAAEKLPGVLVHPGDIRDFRLGRTFDAVTSMYSTVGYMRSTAELDAAVSAMAGHVSPGGVLIVEPWYFPHKFIDGHIGDDVIRTEGRTVARIARSVRHGDAVHQQAHYVVADSAGVRHFEHVQIFTLFSPAEYEAAFLRAGCTVEYVEPGDILAGRGLFVGIRH